MADDIEVVAMEMERVAFCTENASALHHQLNACIERKHFHLCPISHPGVIRGGACVIEWNQRVVGEVGCVYSIGLPKVVGLEDCCGWLDERDIVD